MQTLGIRISKQKVNGGILTCRRVTVREKLLRFLLGTPIKLTVLVPGDTVSEVTINEGGKLRSKYYDNFSAFQMKIDSIIDSTTKDNLTKVKRLIGEKVQLFDGMNPITENTFECSKHRHCQAA